MMDQTIREILDENRVPSDALAISVVEDGPSGVLVVIISGDPSWVELNSEDLRLLQLSLIGSVAATLGKYVK
jgi:hypothetical protein